MIAALRMQHRNNVHFRESGSDKADGRGSSSDKSITVIFAHGFGCGQNMWLYFLSACDIRFRTFLFDPVGCGQAKPSAYDYQKYSTPAGYANDPLEIIGATVACLRERGI